MTDVIPLLQQLAAQLQQEGKTPSLALFRARLAGRVAPQQLFAAYQHWRNNPVYAAIPSGPAEPDTEQPAATAEAEDIHARLTRIEAKLDLLLGKLGSN